MRLPLAERGAAWASSISTAPARRPRPWFDDAEALWDVVVERGLEGLVAKRLPAPYRPGERDWIKVKNRDYWRYGLELEPLGRRRSCA
jgi:bifunctional non-homologous end joining protein LigD